MGAFKEAAHDDAVVLGDQVLDRETQVREAAAQELDGAPEARAPPGVPGAASWLR
jgi:hypothetical protein